MRYLRILALSCCTLLCSAALFVHHYFGSQSATTTALHQASDDTSLENHVPALSKHEDKNELEYEYENEAFSDEWNEAESISERQKYERERLADPATGQIPPDIHIREREFVRTLPTREDVSRQGKNGAALQSFDWSVRGPNGTGGRTRALAIDVTNERVLLAGGVTGGLWRSENGGETWRNITLPDGAENISCIVQDTRPGKEQTWYIGTGELYTAFYGTGVYKSVDGGRTWRGLPATSPVLSSRFSQFATPWSVVIRLVIDHTNRNRDVVYAAVTGAVMRSQDGGESWEEVLGNTTNSQPTNFSRFTDVAISPNGTLYAALSEWDFTNQLGFRPIQSGIWRSTTGTAWTNISPTFATLGQAAVLPSGVQVGRMVLATAPSDDNIVYVLRDLRGSVFPSGIRTGLLRYTYLSGNGAGASGGAWTDYTSTFPQDFTSQTGYCMALKVKPDDALFVLAGGVFAYSNPYNFRYRETTNLISSFATNTDIPPPPTQSWADHHDFVFLPSNPNVMYAANDGGIYRTENCTATPVRYTPRNGNYMTTQFYTLAIDRATRGDETIIGGLQDNGTRMVNSVSAAGRLINLGDGVHCQIADGGRYYYASSQFANINRFEFDARGRRINQITINPSSGLFQRFFLDNPYVLDPNNQKMMYLAGGVGLWRNADVTSLNPTELQAGWGSIGTVTGTGERITALAVSQRPANVVYVGTSQGRVYRMDDANDSKRLLRNVSGNFTQNGFISCVAIDPTNADWSIVVFSNYNTMSVYATTDGGKSWNPVSGNLEQTLTNGVGGGPSVAWVKIAYVGGKVWYLAGTSSGLFSTDRLNGMNTRWIREGASTIGVADVRMVDVRSVDGFAAVATHGRGLFSAYLPTQTRRFDVATPTLTVGQSFPNPAPRTEVTIPMFLPRSTRITITLWNALGQAVMRPVEADFTAGEQFLVLPTRNITSGVYVYQVETSDGEQARGTMVIRQ
ncbi:MAG: T9SS type A sorting domain-containing protein [Candidatus Kapabacteria bacterium]|jgi:photosystem II stability/assembly factor-like uncharacterized protein|nr:T9SS type A sorting domain-containing protein [Candidatus Kapabacteria bacterium]